MHAVILEEVLKQIFSFLKSEKRSGLLYGRMLDDGDVVQLIDANTDDTMFHKRYKNGLIGKAELQVEQVGIWFYGPPDKVPTKKESQVMCELKKLSKDVKTPLLLVLYGNQKDPRIDCYAFNENGTRDKVSFEISGFEQRLFKRTHKIVDNSYLSRKTVTIVGLGSGGSRVALELAKSGVGTLKLIDYDRLEVENISRHICGSFDLGRKKTIAVRDLIVQHNPLINVETYNIDVLKSRSKFTQIIKESDVVVSATGSAVVNNLTNEFCLSQNIPAVYAGAWEKAMAGYIMRVIPGETACFNCVHETLLKTAPPTDKKRIINYSIVSDPNELKAEPGLSIDVGIITLLQAKLTLLILLKEVESGLEDIPQNYILWLNKSYDRFTSLSCLKLHTHRKSDCSVCNYENWLKEKEKELKND